MLWAVAGPFLRGGVCITGLGLALEVPSGITWTGTFVASLLYVSLVGTAPAWVLWLGLIRAGRGLGIPKTTITLHRLVLYLGAL